MLWDWISWCSLWSGPPLILLPFSLHSWMLKSSLMAMLILCWTVLTQDSPSTGIYGYCSHITLITYHPLKLLHASSQPIPGWAYWICGDKIILISLTWRKWHCYRRSVCACGNPLQASWSSCVGLEAALLAQVQPTPLGLDPLGTLCTTHCMCRMCHQHISILQSGTRYMVGTHKPPSAPSTPGSPTICSPAKWQACAGEDWQLHCWE